MGRREVGIDLAGRQLDELLAEAAAARAARSLSRCAEAMDDALLSRDLAAVADAAPIARALRELERLTAGPMPDELDVAPLLERIATMHLIASGRLSLLRTRIPSLPASARVARCMVAVVRELLHVVESAAARDPDGHEASLVVTVDDGFVTFVGTAGEGAAAVPTGTGADAMARLTRLADACGGAVRRRVGDGAGIRIGVALGVQAASL